MNGKRKLMLISPMLHQGGFERVCVTTARVMEPYFDITIVIFDSADIAFNVDGLNIVNINMGVQKGKIRKALNIIRRSLKIRHLKKEMRPDIVYSFGLTANMVNAFSKTKREKVWLGLRSYADLKETAKIRLFVKQADLIICCSRDIERDLNHNFKFHKTATLYNLYDADAIRMEAGAKEPWLPLGETDKEGRRLRCLVSMGREDDMKAFWHMLKVFSLVHERIPESRLMLLGDGGFEQYKKLARELKIADTVYFAGMQKEPYQYLKKAEIYLLTSSNEGFPNALVEGMALSLAPVSVNCKSGPAEILMENGDTESVTQIFDRKKEKKEKNVIYGEYGILVPAMDAEPNLNADEISEEEQNMAEVVVDLMQNPGKLKAYQEAAAQRVHIFSCENYIKCFLKLADFSPDNRR